MTAPAPASTVDIWPFVRPRTLALDPLAQAAVFVVMVTGLFLIFPGIDLWASEIFFAGDGPGRAFPAAGLEGLKALRKLAELSLIVPLVAMAAVLAIKLITPGQPTLIDPRHILFSVSALIAGPVILVNLIFKAIWGRPRPVHIEPFGGEHPFVGVWEITDYCASNCSFVSGEASSALWLITLVAIVPSRWRRAAMTLFLALALALGLNRIAFGGHFLSDVLLSWGMTLMVIVAIHRLLYLRPGAAPSDAALETSLSELGSDLRRPFRRNT